MLGVRSEQNSTWLTDAGEPLEFTGATRSTSAPISGMYEYRFAASPPLTMTRSITGVLPLVDQLRRCWSGRWIVIRSDPCQRGLYVPARAPPSTLYDEVYPYWAHVGLPATRVGEAAAATADWPVVNAATAGTSTTDTADNTAMVRDERTFPPLLLSAKLSAVSYADLFSLPVRPSLAQTTERGNALDREFRHGLAQNDQDVVQSITDRGDSNTAGTIRAARSTRLDP